jgi:hypothetical protein
MAISSSFSIQIAVRLPLLPGQVLKGHYLNLPDLQLEASLLQIGCKSMASIYTVFLPPESLY